jgi:hypothetical protein
MHLPGDAHLHPSGLSMFDDGLVSSDKWTAFASSLPVSSVSNLMACLRLVGARQGMITFIGKEHVSGVASHSVEVGVEVGLNIVAAATTWHDDDGIQTW